MRRAVFVCCAATLVGAFACDRKERRDIDSARPETSPDTAEPAPMGSPQRGTEGAPGALKEERSQPVRKAEADFQSAEGLKVDGDVQLEEVDNGVRLVVEVDDAPAGTKAIHVHEKGDCSNMKKQSMGSHFNPAGQPHGMPASPKHHAGDLGNIVIDASGDGKLEIVARNVNLKPNDPMSILDRAIVIHESEDKGTQPTGGSGNPIACAVIRAD